jgi:hypothetical protein
MFDEGVKIEKVGRVRVERLGQHLDVAIEPPGLGSALVGLVFLLVMIALAIVLVVTAREPVGGVALTILTGVVLAAIMIGRSHVLDALMRISFVSDGATFVLRRQSRLEKTEWSADVAHLEMQYLDDPIDRSGGQAPRLLLTCDGAELEIGIGSTREEMEVVLKHWRLARGAPPRTQAL